MPEWDLADLYPTGHADADTLPAPVRRKARRAARAAADLKATIAALYEEMT